MQALINVVVISIHHLFPPFLSPVDAGLITRTRAQVFEQCELPYLYFFFLFSFLLNIDRRLNNYVYIWQECFFPRYLRYSIQNRVKIEKTDDRTISRGIEQRSRKKNPDPDPARIVKKKLSLNDSLELRGTSVGVDKPANNSATLFFLFSSFFFYK